MNSVRDGQFVLNVQIEIAPEFADLYPQLQASLPPQIILGRPNYVHTDNLVDFANPITKKNELRILDRRTGVFVSFPRQNTLALYSDSTLLVETQKPSVKNLAIILNRVLQNLELGRAWNCKGETVNNLARSNISKYCPGKSDLSKNEDIFDFANYPENRQKNYAPPTKALLLQNQDR